MRRRQGKHILHVAGQVSDDGDGSRINVMFPSNAGKYPRMVSSKKQWLDHVVRHGEGGVVGHGKGL